jgi:hypothetical protein
LGRWVTKFLDAWDSVFIGLSNEDNIIVFVSRQIDDQVKKLPRIVLVDEKILQETAPFLERPDFRLVGLKQGSACFIGP